MEMESDHAITYLDGMVIREETTLATHTGQYLNFNSNHPLHVKRGLIQSLQNRASTICQEQDMVKKISSLRSDLQLRDYPHGSFTRSLIPGVAVI
jgi:hypothetical protein